MTGLPPLGGSALDRFRYRHVGPVELLLGDAGRVLTAMPDATVDCVVTSPPFWALRDYGTGGWQGGELTCPHQSGRTRPVDGGRCGRCRAVWVDPQYGLEPTVEEYVDRLVAVFEQVRRVLTRMRVGEIVAEPLVVRPGVLAGGDLRRRVRDLLYLVGLRAEDETRFPHQFSGGQRQRIGIARAIALDPDVLLCNEPVSALDLSVQALVVNLLMRLKRELGLSIVFVVHDLSVVRHVSDPDRCDVPRRGG
jgi:energy-coupling factor transporter ATP-binding protein EcfA2